MPVWVILIASGIYMLGLFVLAWQGDKRAGDRHFAESPTRYALALGVYCTSWTFFGAVGTAASSGWEFLPIYLGPIIVFLFLPGIIERIAKVSKRESITSLSDFLAARYGKSRVLGSVAAIAAVIGTLPYIALQLKSVGWSFQALLFGQSDNTRQPPDETVLVTALILGAFAVLFGARHTDSTRSNVGLMRVLAFEAMVKLGALFAVCCVAIGLLMSNQPIDASVYGGEITPSGNPFASSDISGRFITITILSMAAIICLPRQFHVGIIEHRSQKDIQRARWLFPLYLVATSAMVIPIALAGMTLLPDHLPADLYVLEIPLAVGDELLALLVFLGGFSAAMGMVIVSTIALSTMVTNDLIVPQLMKYPSFDVAQEGAGQRILLIRRLIIFVLLALAYLYYRAAAGTDALAQIGLLSFAAAAQFIPSLLGAVYWKGGRTSGAIAGLVTGMSVWAYTLFLPKVIGFERMMTVLPDALSPHALLGLTFGDELTHGAFWSLTLNTVVFIIVSHNSRERLRDRIQAAAFVDGASPSDLTPGDSTSDRSGSRVSPDGLKALASRFLTPEAVDHSFARFELETGIPATGDGPADWRLVQRSEKLLASALGASSARVVMSSAVGGMDVALGDVLSILDHKTQAERFDRHMLQSMLENIPSGISVVDSEQKLVAWNGAYLELFQYPSKLVHVGQPISRLIEHNIKSGWIQGDPVTTARRRVDQMRAGTAHIYERESIDGRWLRITGNPMPGGGYVTIFHDITEDKAREQALLDINETLETRVMERTAELESMAGDLDRARLDAEGANASKTRFLAAASHDLLQPLNAARLFLASIEGSAPQQAPLSEKTIDLVKKADRSIQSADGLLKGLLDISRLDHGSVEAQPENLMLGPLLEDLVDEATPMAERAGLSIRVVPTPHSVHADPDFLQSILRNFISNARRYTRSGGILVGARRRGEHVRIEVWDTGPGIPESKQASLFEEFQRLEDADNLGVRGAGLGLSVAKRLANLMDAQVGVRSVVGKGSVFHVTLPIGESQKRHVRSQQSIQKRNMRPVPKLRVLCVDDEPTILDAMTGLLEGWGCIVEREDTYEGAVKALRSSIFDVLLADLELTGDETGIDLIVDCRDALSNPVQCALITAKATPEIEALAGALRVSVFRKPVEPENIRSFLVTCTPETIDGTQAAE